jgi:predicted dehydrogenase
MDTKKIKTAFLGITEKDQSLLETVWDNKSFRIAALAGNNQELVENFAGRYECAGFDDFRQLVVRNELDLLVVTAPIHLCEDYVKTAMKKGINILKLMPPALDFEQTVEFMQIAQKQKVKYFVANPFRFSPALGSIAEHVSLGDNNESYLVRCLCSAPVKLDEPAQRWLNDPKLAGGGVFLRDCYHLIDLIVSNFGLPQQVFCLTTNHAPDKQQRLSITEDTATVQMKFSDTLMCSLVASRRFGPASTSVTVHTSRNFVTFTGETIRINDNSGDIVKEEKFEAEPREQLEKMLQGIATALLEPGRNQTNPNTRNLKNMALIEAAYLSSRTAMPEEPHKVLEMAGNHSRGI